MSYLDQRMSPARIWAMVIVAVLHVLIGFAFVTGFYQRFTGETSRDLDVFDVQEPPPPEEEPPPPDEPVPEVQSPEIVTPPPMVRPPTPPPPQTIRTQTTPSAPTITTRADTVGEVRPQPRQTFTCWNGQSVYDLGQCPSRPPEMKRCPNGTQVPVTQACPAPAKPPSPARLISGSISNADYPAAAIRAEAEGVTRITLTVSPDGRATGCSVTGSSGNSALDQTACRLAQRRFRFQAATRNGQPVAGSYSTSIRWQLQN